MKPGIRYIVTKGSDDGTFKNGDHIHMLTTGDILCREAGGWVEFSDVPSSLVGMEYEVDQEWLQRKLAEVERIKQEYA